MHKSPVTGPPPLTDDLLHPPQRRHAGVLVVLRLCLRLTQGSHMPERVTQHRDLDGLGPCLLEPIEMHEHPLSTQQAARLTPFLACQMDDRVVELRLRPLAVVETAIRVKES